MELGLLILALLLVCRHLVFGLRLLFLNKALRRDSAFRPRPLIDVLRHVLQVLAAFEEVRLIRVGLQEAQLVYLRLLLAFLVGL